MPTLIMAREQYDFTLAEGHYNAARARADAAIAALPDPAEREGPLADAYLAATVAIEDAHGVWERADALRAAGDALIAWAVAKVRREQGDHPVLALVPRIRRSATARRKMLNLCWSLDPRELGCPGTH